MKQEAVAVGAENKRNVEGFSIIQTLLHAGPQGMVVILGLNDGNRTVWFVVEDVVRALDFLFVAHKDGTGHEGFLLPDLFHLIPPSLFQGRRDEFGADVPFA